MLRFRDKIHPPRKDFTHGADLCGDMFDGVQDHAVLLAENNIAVLAHQLDDQKLAADITQFI